MTTTVDTMALARAERAEFADFLATLTDEQWDAPTLCTRWRVREVVAHVYSYEDLGFADLVGRFVRGGLGPARVNQVGVDARAGASPAELVALARRCTQPRGMTARLGGRLALLDGMIHQQDIRRSLRLPREIPEERLRCALEFGKGQPMIGAPRHIKGLTLSATDLTWSTGLGPAVEGPGEALLMAMAGRPVTDELTGPGVTTLESRLPRT